MTHEITAMNTEETMENKLEIEECRENQWRMWRAEMAKFSNSSTTENLPVEENCNMPCPENSSAAGNQQHQDTKNKSSNEKIRRSDKIYKNNMFYRYNFSPTTWTDKQWRRHRRLVEGYQLAGEPLPEPVAALADIRSKSDLMNEIGQNQYNIEVRESDLKQIKRKRPNWTEHKMTKRVRQRLLVNDPNMDDIEPNVSINAPEQNVPVFTNTAAIGGAGVTSENNQEGTQIQPTSAAASRSGLFTLNNGNSVNLVKIVGLNWGTNMESIAQMFGVDHASIFTIHLLSVAITGYTVFADLRDNIQSANEIVKYNGCIGRMLQRRPTRKCVILHIKKTNYNNFFDEFKKTHEARSALILRARGPHHMTHDDLYKFFKDVGVARYGVKRHWQRKQKTRAQLAEYLVCFVDFPLAQKALRMHNSTYTDKNGKWHRVEVYPTSVPEMETVAGMARPKNAEKSDDKNKQRNQKTARRQNSYQMLVNRQIKYQNKYGIPGPAISARQVSGFYGRAYGEHSEQSEQQDAENEDVDSDDFMKGERRKALQVRDMIKRQQRQNMTKPQTYGGNDFLAADSFNIGSSGFHPSYDLGHPEQTRTEALTAANSFVPEISGMSTGKPYGSLTGKKARKQQKKANRLRAIVEGVLAGQQQRDFDGTHMDIFSGPSNSQAADYNTNTPAKHCVRIVEVSPHVTTKDVVNFFAPLAVKNVNAAVNPTNNCIEALVEFPSHIAAVEAMKRDGLLIGGASVQLILESRAHQRNLNNQMAQPISAPDDMTPSQEFMTPYPYPYPISAIQDLTPYPYVEPPTMMHGPPMMLGPPTMMYGPPMMPGANCGPMYFEDPM